MANCSIPNSTPANGRISTRSSRRSKKASNYRIAVASLVRRFAPDRTPNIEHPTSNIEFEKQQRASVRRSALDVRCSTFSFFWRVKGAWWPSRSSKPSLSRKWQGRFDSYPLRLTIFDRRLLRHRSSGFFNPKSKFENRKSGERR